MTRRVALYTLPHLSATISIGVYLPVCKLPLWRRCNKHWHTLMQPSVGPKPSPFFGTAWRWWRWPRLGSHIRIPTWQHLLKAYTYPRLASLGSTWADLCSWQSSQLWLLFVWHAPWKSAYRRTTTVGEGII